MELNELTALSIKNIEAEIEFQSDFCDNNTTICRICLERNQLNKMCSIFDSAKPVYIYNMIMSCASVQVVEGDGLPSMICHKCMTKLSIAWEFKMQCENSDAKLRQLCAGSHLNATSDLESFSLTLRQEQSLSEAKDEVYNPLLNFSDSFVMSDNNSIKSDGQSSGDADLDRKNKKMIKSKSAHTTKLKERKIHQCDTCGKTFHRREYLTQHIRIHTGEKPYRCHLCDKRFVNSGHLTTHMRTHTGERPHACTLCPKAFSTRQELQKHTMVHNGERPFVCKMCDKRFGSSSNLYSHLRHHTGEKNFTCEHCGKAFYTKQELKQHLVVHTGEKAYLCECCHKRFAQIAHLKRHSKIHK